MVGRLDRVELKAILDDELETVLAVLGAEVNPPRTRRIHYLDTPDLALHRRGVIVRTRITDTSGRAGADEDVVVKLRRPAPPARVEATGLIVELDALPVQMAWAASMKRRLAHGDIDRELVRRSPARGLLRKKQRALLTHLAGDEVDIDDLVVLGPVDVVRVTSGRKNNRIGVESWMLPDGSRIVELFAKCSPARSAKMVTHIRDLITDRGLALAHRQDTKTGMSLEWFAEGSN